MRILGLDLGTTSVGFAIIDRNDAGDDGRILRMGVRIFPEGVAPGTPGKARETRNKKRRSARLLRRQLRRRKWRRRELGSLLHELGLLPAYGSQAWLDAMQSDPYELRRRALEGVLTAPELGRAFYHLHKRRGFSGGRIASDEPPVESTTRKKSAKAATEETSGSDGDEDTRKIKEEIADLGRSIGASTLGAYLAQQGKKRGRHLGRDHVEAEFDRIVAAQAAHHTEALAAARVARLRALLFEQRPTFWRLNTLGECPLIPGAMLCAKGSWAGQQFVALEHLNKLRIVGQNARVLDQHERGIVYDLLMRQRSVTFGAIRKALKSYWRQHDLPLDAAFNLEREDKTIPGNGIEARLRELFGPAWEEHPAKETIRRTLGARLHQADYRQAPGGKRIEIRSARDSDAARADLSIAFRSEWQVDANTALALSGIEPQPGWLRFSQAAVDTMLSEMERGVGVGDLLMSPTCGAWRDEHFPERERPTGELSDKLPSGPDAMGDLRNPTVNRTLNEARKVVNNLISLYGKPDLIRVELARDLRKSGKRRAEMERENAERERARKKARAALEEIGLAQPSRGDIEKWLLWKECNETCPYTGGKIGCRDLFFDGIYQVEHIFPRSRSLDNSFANKTLCHVEVNREKGERSPHEAFGTDATRWETVTNALKSAKLPERKAQRFVKPRYLEVSDGEDFAERQLRDTAYAARAARDFLRRLYPDVGPSGQDVETCNGSITAELRHQWGLESILSAAGASGKNRDDHRHHAVDALAVALTDRSAVKQLADWHAADRQGRKPDFRKPWPSLLEDARRSVGEIVVSYRVQRKLSGPLHEERPLGKVVDEQSGTVRYVRRKPISALSASEIADIRDEGLRNQIQAAFGHLLTTIAEAKPQSRSGAGHRNLSDAKGTKKKAEQELKLALSTPFSFLQRDGGRRIVNKVRIWVDRADNAVVQVRKLDERSLHAQKTYAELGSALHGFAVYSDNAGGSAYKVLSRAEVVARTASGDAPYPASLPGGFRLKVVLYPGDVLRRQGQGECLEYFMVRKFNQAGRVFYKPHTMAVVPKPEISFGVSQFTDGTVVKVAVDPIGRVRPASD